MSDFIIENGMLKKYCGTEAHVVIPEGVTSIGEWAFAKHSELVSVKIPEGVTSVGKCAFDRCINLTSVEMPGSVTIIGEYAFDKCLSLIDIVIPENVTTIGQSAFCQCESLEKLVIPKNVKIIGRSAFSGCKKLKSVKILAESLTIELFAFWDCTKIEYLEIPSGVERVLKMAFSDCTGLKSVQITSIKTSIEADSFPPNCEIEVLDYCHIKGKDRIAPTYPAMNPKLPGTDEMRAYALLYQKANAWLQWSSDTAENPADVLAICKELIKAEPKLTTGPAKRVVEFMRAHSTKLSSKSIEDVLALMEEKGGKPDRQPFERILGGAEQAEPRQEDPYETFVSECLKDYVFEEEAITAVNSRTKIRRKETDVLVPLEQVRYIVSELVHLWNECKQMEDGEYKADIAKVGGYRIPDAVTRMMDTMNRKDLDDYLRKLIYSTKYRSYVLAYGALASVEEINGMLSEIGRKLKGPSKECRWAEQMESGLYLRDDRETMLFFDRIGKLEAYAQLRFGMDEQELRDTHMMPQFGFDEDGIKRYDIGGNIIEVSIAPDLSCQLFDTKAKKIIRSMPKKSDDPEKATACASDYAEFKKSIKDFYKQRMSNLHMLHAEGTFIKGDLWKRVYMDHPAMKILARLLVWQDESGKSFIPSENSIIDVNGDIYEPIGNIQLAHVVSLSPEERISWQNYFAQNQLAQPFMQVWEQVVQWDSDTIASRYRNKKITPETRNALRKKLETQGVRMRSDVAVTGYDYNRKPIFADEGKLVFGQFYSLEYMLLKEVLWLVQGKVKLLRECAMQVRRGMNAVIPQLDFAIAHDVITKKTDLKLEQIDLSALTAAQIDELIDLAAASRNVSCQAWLLNLKNERFSDCNAVDPFVLEL